MKAHRWRYMKLIIIHKPLRLQGKVFPLFQSTYYLLGVPGVFIRREKESRGEYRKECAQTSVLAQYTHANELIDCLETLYKLGSLKTPSESAAAILLRLLLCDDTMKHHPELEHGQSLPLLLSVLQRPKVTF
jgi:hypothetical protein